MPSRLEGGDKGKIALSGVANNPVEVRILLLQQLFYTFLSCGVMELGRHALLSRGWGFRDKRGVMPIKQLVDWG